MLESDKAQMDYNFSLEKRITRVETQSTLIREDLKEIKLTLKWVVGIIFALNGTIIGILSKAIM